MHRTMSGIKVTRSAGPLRSLGRILLTAGWVCLAGPAVQAQFVVQSLGLQAQARPNTVVRGKIRLLNASRRECQTVRLKAVELIKAEDHQWRPLDPNGPEDVSKIASCRSWIRLGLTDVIVRPIDLVTIPVAIQVPEGLTGLYRAAVTVSMPSSHQNGVATGYDIAVPVLLEIKDEDDLATLEPNDYVVEITPKPIKIDLDTASPDPFHTYVGSGNAEIYTSFDSQRTVTAVVGTSPAGGKWRGSAQEGEIRVSGEDVRIENLTGGSTNLAIAVVAIQVVPIPSAWPFVWPDL